MPLMSWSLHKFTQMTLSHRCSHIENKQTDPKNYPFVPRETEPVIWGNLGKHETKGEHE